MRFAPPRPAPDDRGRSRAGSPRVGRLRPACARVTMTRAGGESRAPYASLNLDAGTGDAPATVARNRARVLSALGIEREPCWLDQMHGSNVVRAAHYERAPRADASVGRAGSPPCAVLTADCLPVVLCDMSGTRVGIAHAGWRGLASGVIASCIACMDRPGRELLAWLGPAIGPESYEVGPRFAMRVSPPSRARGRIRPFSGANGSMARQSVCNRGAPARIAGGRAHLRRRLLYLSRREPVLLASPANGITGRFATLAWIHESGHGRHDPAERTYRAFCLIPDPVPASIRYRPPPPRVRASPRLPASAQEARNEMDKLTTRFQMALSDAQSLAVGHATSSWNRCT